VPGDLEPGAPLNRRGGRLDEAAGDGRDRPAALASNVLVVLARSLEAGLSVSEVDPNHRPLVLEPAQRPEHRREVRGHAAIRQRIPQLLDRPVVARVLDENLSERGADVGGPCDGTGR
jgi:hypothetical protein